MDQQHQQRNIILATVISIAILLAFQFFTPKPQHPPATSQTTSQPAPAPSAGVLPVVPRQELLARAPRIAIDTPRLAGSINLYGARLDDLRLKDYRETIDPSSPEVVVLSPDGAKSLVEGTELPQGLTKPEDIEKAKEKAAQDPYFIDIDWAAPGNPGIKLPPPDAKWIASAEKLSPEHPVDLTWDNGAGLRFTYHYAVDDNYMFTITPSVENDGDQAVTLAPIARITRKGTPAVSGTYILHEGPLAVLNGKLHDGGWWLSPDSYNYADVKKGPPLTDKTTGGWLGFTDKYWLTALIPNQQEQVTTEVRYSNEENRDVYEAEFRGTERSVPPHGKLDAEDRLFAGAKEVHLLDHYESTLGIPRFDRAIDFGLFYWITKPIFLTLDFFSKHVFSDFVGSFGFAILLLTFLIKLLVFPLANMSYRSMSKMKMLQPKIQELRERFGEDRQRLNQEMMALYKTAGANPMGGCLPIFVQIPVFFSLYKVLYVNIEMWHAPFYGWIHDLSARDPTTIFNLFGLIPFTPPDYLGPVPLFIGIWPLIMGVTMFLQQKLNPPPPDPVQAKMFMFLPILFTFMMSQFAAGLVIYWTWNNLLSIAQQWTIMRRAGTSKPRAVPGE